MTTVAPLGVPGRATLRTRATKLLRLSLAFVFAVGITLGISFGSPTRAFAAGDQIDEFNVSYVVQPSGVVTVKESITYRFGDTSGRRGIERFLVTREPYDAKQDAVYAITNLTVSSPDPVATQFSSTTSKAKKGREEQLRLRIGDPNQQVSTPTATYVISYDVAGAMRNSPGYDEFSWDATGLDWTATIKSVTISATVPGGAQELSCFRGVAKSKDTCPTKIVNGVGQFTADNLGPTQGVSIGTKIKPGLLADNKPHLEPDASQLTAKQKLSYGLLAALGLVVTVGSPLAGVFWWRKNGRDRRYAGLAPGTVPLAGEQAQVVANDPDIPIPVAFSPPKIPVAEAGLLVDGQVDARETAATIIDLAVRGALTVQSADDSEFLVTLVDPNKATAPHEMVLLTNLFNGAPPGAMANLSAAGSLLPAHQAMREAVRDQVASRGWFTKVPSSKVTGGAGVGALAFGGFAIFGLGAAAAWVLVPLLPIVITIGIIRLKMRRGQRTADGRAVCDQVEGFKTYLATAEAEQLRFEEGEDIFSRYLPWAIAFELADRWAKVCGDLVAMGRLPDTTPYWFYGSYSMAAFNTSFLTSSLTSAATPAPSEGSSGTGFGGGSSFGGGGFSGGGGGGGGGGSW